MASYLTQAEAYARLSAFDFDSEPSSGALELASRRLDAMGPFKGSRYEYPQELAFPRSYTAEGETEGEVPPAVLDWVALEAHKLTQVGVQGDQPPVTSVSIGSAGSVTFARPAMNTATSYQCGLLAAYQRTTGTLR